MNNVNIKKILLAGARKKNLSFDELAMLLETSTARLTRVFNGTVPLSRESEIIACNVLGVSPYDLFGLDKPTAISGKKLSESIQSSLAVSIEALIDTVRELGEDVGSEYEDISSTDEAHFAVAHLAERVKDLVNKNKKKMAALKKPVAYLFDVRSQKGEHRVFAALDYVPSCGDAIVKRQGLIPSLEEQSVEFV